MCLCHDSDLLLLQFLPRLLLLLSLHELEMKMHTSWLIGWIKLVCLGHACKLACFCLVVMGVPIGPVMTRTFIVIILLERAFLCGTSAIVLCVLPAVSMENVVEVWSDAASQRKRKNEVQWAKRFSRKARRHKAVTFWRGQHKHRKKEKKEQPLHTDFS